jgi:hypothetical protein
VVALSAQAPSGLWKIGVARSAIAAAVAILVQAAVINANPLASAPSEGSYAVVRFAPQATADDITNPAAELLSPDAAAPC